MSLLSYFSNPKCTSCTKRLFFAPKNGKIQRFRILIFRFIIYIRFFQKAKIKKQRRSKITCVVKKLSDYFGLFQNPKSGRRRSSRIKYRFFKVPAYNGTSCLEKRDRNNPNLNKNEIRRISTETKATQACENLRCEKSLDYFGLSRNPKSEIIRHVCRAYIPALP